MSDQVSLEAKLDTAIELLRYLVVLELAKNGVPRSVIAKQVRVANAKVSGMLKGIKTESANSN